MPRELLPRCELCLEKPAHEFVYLWNVCDRCIRTAADAYWRIELLPLTPLKDIVVGEDYAIATHRNGRYGFGSWGYETFRGGRVEVIDKLRRYECKGFSFPEAVKVVSVDPDTGVSRWEPGHYMVIAAFSILCPWRWYFASIQGAYRDEHYSKHGPKRLAPILSLPTA